MEGSITKYTPIFTHENIQIVQNLIGLCQAICSDPSRFSHTPAPKGFKFFEVIFFYLFNWISIRVEMLILYQELEIFQKCYQKFLM